MLPLILISNRSETIDQWVTDFIKKHKILPYSVFSLSPIAPKTEITIDQVRQVRKQMITQSSQSRLFVISQFETAAAEAQNALLKTLEEKSELNLFILTASSAQTILPTILSRANLINLDTSADSEVKEDKAIQTILESLATDTFSFLTNKEMSNITKEAAISLFDQIILFLRLRMVEKNELASLPLLKTALKQKDLLISNNLNPQLTIDSFLLSAKKHLQK